MLKRGVRCKAAPFFIEVIIKEAELKNKNFGVVFDKYR